MTEAWAPLEPDRDAILRQCARPVQSLATGDIPALIFRAAYSRADCRRIVSRLIEREHIYDPTQPVAPKFVEAGIPEGYYREGRSSMPSRAWDSADDSEPKSELRAKRRIDIGSSLGYRGSDPGDFFAHADAVREIFRDLFQDMTDPVALIYESLESVAPGHRVRTAREPDGREYGPAIIRAHYGGYSYQPHFDSVRLREKRTDYSVYRYEHQFAGVLVLQNAEIEGVSAQCTVHRCLWQPEVEPHLRAGTFRDFARERGIENLRVELAAGDLYFFNTRNIHEVPGVAGDLPRVVVGTFLGYSPDEEEIAVWS